MSESPLVIAVIDDDPAIRRLLTSIARTFGDVVVDAANCRDGQILLAEYPWDIAVIDRTLPDGDGLELCRLAASYAQTGLTHRHILFLSAATTTDDKLHGFEVGADEYIEKPADPIELRARMRAIRRTVATQKALLARLASLEQLSVIDGLTQVYNHRFFESELRRLFEISARHQRPLALAMLDLDHFKSVNDQYGHRIGDQVLTETSTAIAQAVRSTDVVARYGGEEFAVLLPETTSPEAALFAERMRLSVQGLLVQANTVQLEPTISIGVAAVPAPGIDTPARLIEAADAALYEAKKQGRNCVRVYPGAPFDNGPDGANRLTTN